MMQSRPSLESGMAGPPGRTTGQPVAAQGPGLTAAAARELLGRTAELPNSKRELLAVLTEYRAALFALACKDGYL
jgi:hypothetical protein